MEDKTFELLEKMYSEFLSFKEEMTDFKKEVGERFDKVENRLTKIEINQEEIKDKATEALEAFDAISEINQKQHEEIMRELKGDIEIVQLAVKRTAK